MDWIKFRAILFASKRFVIPAILGSIIVWLIANGYQPWADVVCAISDAILIDVKECR